MTRNRMGDRAMLALGSCLAGSGILIAGLLALLFQHPNAPRWTRPQLVPMLICMPLTLMIGVGLAFTAAGLWQLVKGTGDPLELVVLAAVVVGLKVVWHILGIRQRLNAYALRNRGASPLVIDETHALEFQTETPPPRYPLDVRRLGLMLYLRTAEGSDLQPP